MSLLKSLVELGVPAKKARQVVEKHRTELTAKRTRDPKTGALAPDRPTRFKLLCRERGVPMPATEYKFHAKRRWRWDYAWPNADGGGVALECDGGLFVGGAHVRGARILKTHEKLNHAAADGWRVLFCTPSTLFKPETVELVRRALQKTEAA